MFRPDSFSRAILFSIVILMLAAASVSIRNAKALEVPSTYTLTPDFFQNEFWQKKDYHQWSEGDCKKLLENSPWAQKYTMATAVMEHIKERTGSAGNDMNRESTPTIEYNVQFRSALPIRQAVARLAEIKQKYDQMKPEQKKAIDQQTDRFLNGNYQGRIVLYVAYAANVRADDANLAIYWQKQTTDILKNSVFLINQRGDRVPLIEYTVNGGAAREFQFDFPRQQGERPVILPDDKTVKLEFVHPAVGNTSETRVVITFNPAKMLVAGTPVY